MDQKPKGLNINNFTKLDHTRLTSLGMKRDLSLGGNKSRKVYKPNLNVVRNKDKPKEIIRQVQQQAKQRQRLGVRQSRETPKYVSSDGLFSEAIISNSVPRIRSDRCFADRETDSQLPIPKITKTWDKSVGQDDDKVVQELIFNEDDSESDEDGQYQPVALPLNSNKGTFKRTFGLNSIKTSQKEVDNPEVLPINNHTPKGAPHLGLRSSLKGDSKYGCEQTDPLSPNQYNNYDDDNPNLSLIMIPHSLAGKGFDENDKKIDYNLSQMAEGKIGTIKVRKSGRMDVQIGNAVYQLHSMHRTPFKENLVYVPENLKVLYGQDVTALGTIDTNYMLTPRWSHLFEERKKQSKPTLHNTNRK